MTVYDPRINELDMIKYCVDSITELSELLKRSNFVSVHLPLSTDIHYMISGQHFKQMKPTTIFIYT